MYLENKKRKPTVIYVTLAFCTGIAGYLGLVQRHLIWLLLFWWWLLFDLILISRYGSRLLVKQLLRKQIAEAEGRAEPVSIWRFSGILLLIALPFYDFWVSITFFTCLNPYFFTVLNFPVLVLSFFAFCAPFATWREIGLRGRIFWMIHGAVFLLAQVLGWGIRFLGLRDFYGF